MHDNLEKYPQLFVLLLGISIFPLSNWDCVLTGPDVHPVPLVKSNKKT